MPGLTTRKIFLSYWQPFIYHQRWFHLNPETIVIASAVRTPWGRYQGQLSHLGSVAVEAAVKQSAIPVEQVKQIYMAETPPLSKGENQTSCFEGLLKKAIFSTVSAGYEVDVKSTILGLHALISKKVDVVVVGGMESGTQNHIATGNFVESSKTLIEPLGISYQQNENYILDSLERYLKAQREGLFEAELVSVTVLHQSGKRKIQMEITQDEVSENTVKLSETTNYCNGAAALLLTTFAKANEYNLTPLAIIKDFEYIVNISNNSSSSLNLIDKLLLKSQLEPNQIQHWEIADCIDLLNLLKAKLNLNFDLVNPHGGSLIFGQSLAASLPRTLTHLTHSLKSSQYGCVLANNSKESLALIIEKFPLPSFPDSLPRLTLYTKDPCHLCDMLVDELELNFTGEYDLEKVYIDLKENVRFLRLYRYDIPVVFLNGQFLCMHRLNNRLLRRKLDLLKEQ